MRSVWTEHDEAAAIAAHATRVAGEQVPEIDGWGGAHGRVGLMTEWDYRDAEREDRLEHDRDAWLSTRRSAGRLVTA